MARIEGLRRTTVCLTDDQIKYALKEAKAVGLGSASSFLRYLLDGHKAAKKAEKKRKKKVH